jgi:preprotein translocase subunit SecE
MEKDNLNLSHKINVQQEMCHLGEPKYVQDDIQKQYQDKIRQERLKTLVIVVVIASLVWGFVGSADLLIVSGVQHLFPTKSKLQYAFIQIFIYIVLLMIVIYITDIDASSLFVSSNHFKLSDAI